MPPSTGSPWSSRGPPGRPGCRRTRCCTGRSRRRTGKRGPAPGQGRPAGHLRQIRRGARLAGGRHPRLRRRPPPCRSPCADALWHGSFKSAPGRSSWSGSPAQPSPMTWGSSPSTRSVRRKPPPNGTPGGGRSSRRMRPASSSSASGTPATGWRRPSSGPSRSVPHPVPADHVVRPLGRPPPPTSDRRLRYARGTTPRSSPSPADMLAALRREFTAARISAISPGQDGPPKNIPDAVTSEAAAA